MKVYDNNDDGKRTNCDQKSSLSGKLKRMHQLDALKNI